MEKIKLTILFTAICLLYLIAIFTFNESYAKSSKVSINSYYIDSLNGDIRITFTTSKDVKYKIFTLSNPSRIILDISNGRWKADGKAKGIAPSVIKKIRNGQPKANILRIVLDLKNPVKIKSHFYNNKRLGFVFKPLQKKKTVRQKTKTKSKSPISMSKSYKLQKDSPFNFPTFNFPSFNVPSFNVPSFRAKKNPSYKKSILKNNNKYYKPIIIIDAGHGGSDPGATGKGKTKEKNITLSYALELTKILSKSGRYKIYLTRTNDKFVSLKNRVARARKAGGDILLSLHADSHPNPKTKGLSVYTLSDKRAKREADKLIKKAGNEEVIRGLDLSRESKDISTALISMAQHETKNTSSILAKILIKELSHEVKLLRNTHRLASLAVLTGADIPSTLIELGYLSNLQEEKLLNNKKYRAKIAGAIKRAIDIYFQKYVNAE